MINETDFDWAQIEVGSAKYDYLMKRFLTTDVSKDEDFQRRFTGFYRIRRSKDRFLCKYYAYMESLKGKEVSFGEVIRTIHTFLGTIEPSFSSKLLATLNTNLPVWDQYVLSNIGIDAPSQYDKTVEKCIAVYQRVVAWYNRFLRTEEAKEMVSFFDRKLPQFRHFSPLKKIDLMFWQKR